MFKKKADNEKRNKVKEIISYAIGVIALILCIYIVTQVIVATSQKRPPRIFGLSVSYVPSGSMEPTIETNSYVLFREASYKECKMDDIIIYYNSNESKYIIHRVVAKVVDGVITETSDRFADATNIVNTTETNYLITMGDNNNNTTDSIAVTKNLVYGKYITGLGFMSIFSSGINPFVIYTILIIIFVIMIGIQTFQLITKKKIDEAKKQNEELKEQLLEDLRKEVLEEELAKLKAQNSLNNTEDNTSESNDNNESNSEENESENNENTADELASIEEENKE